MTNPVDSAQPAVLPHPGAVALHTLVGTKKTELLSEWLETQPDICFQCRPRCLECLENDYKVDLALFELFEIVARHPDATAEKLFLAGDWVLSLGKMTDRSTLHKLPAVFCEDKLDTPSPLSQRRLDVLKGLLERGSDLRDLLEDFRGRNHPFAVDQIETLMSQKDSVIDSWMDSIIDPEPSRGGAGRGQGRKAYLVQGPVFRQNVTLDESTKKILKGFGDGELSRGIRKAAKFIQLFFRGPEQHIYVIHRRLIEKPSAVFSLALSDGTLEEVERLLADGWDPNALTIDGHPIITEVSVLEPEKLMALLNAGARADAVVEMFFGDDYSDDVTLVERLIAEHNDRDESDQRNFLEDTRKHIAILIQHGASKVVRPCLKVPMELQSLVTQEESP